MTEGERWALDALRELRAGGSVARFLVASHRRAAATRRGRPQLARQARAWIAIGVLAWAVPRLRPRARAGVAWWLAVALMLDWHLGMVESEDGEPRMLGPADACTLLRAWLVPLVAAEPRPLVVAIGFATDAADGALARRSVPTRAGRDLEGIVDAVFDFAAVRGTHRAGGLGRTAAALELARLTGGTVYALGSYFGAGRPPAPGLARAARATAPLRAAGLIAAAAGHRRPAGILLGTGAVAGAAAAVRQRERAGLETDPPARAHPSPTNPLERP